MYPFYAFHLRGKKGASLELSLPGHRIYDGQFRRSWNARSTLSSEKFSFELSFRVQRGICSSFFSRGARFLVSLGMTFEKMFWAREIAGPVAQVARAHP
jgi:hypothetical protein